MSDLAKRNFVCVLAIAVALGALVRAADSLQTKTIPAAHWVKIYFESIDRQAERMKLKQLRTLSLRADEIEVRLWEGFGIGPLTGYVMKRSQGTWSALASRQWYKRPLESLAVPRSTDWAATWARLEHDGIREIRDGSQLPPPCSVVLDGVGFVVEIAQGDAYRTYLVSNPQSQRSEDGDRFLRLLPVLLEAFGEKPYVDVTKLPTREMQTVTSVVTQPPAKLTPPTPWKSAVGQNVEAVAELLLSSEEALAQSVDLRTPACSELPEMLRSLRLSGELADIAVEMLIEPSGTVRAVRALSGHPILHPPSFEAALKWKFAPLQSGSQLRGATLTIRYREDWVDFPWLKRSSSSSR